MSVPTVASAHRVVWRSSEGRIQLVPNTIDHDVAPALLLLAQSNVGNRYRWSVQLDECCSLKDHHQLVLTPVCTYYPVRRQRQRGRDVFAQQPIRRVWTQVVNINKLGGFESLVLTAVSCVGTSRKLYAVYLFRDSAPAKRHQSVVRDAFVLRLAALVTSSWFSVTEISMLSRKIRSASHTCRTLRTSSNWMMSNEVQQKSPRAFSQRPPVWYGRSTSKS